MSKRLLIATCAVAALAMGTTGAAAHDLAAAPILPAAQPGDPVDTAKQGRKPGASGGPIVAGDTRFGELRRGEDSYVFEARRGQRMQIALSSDEFDTVLSLTGPGDFAVENDDGPDGSLNSLIDTRLPADGTYRITVSSFQNSGSGSYRLATLDPSNPVPADVEPQVLSPGDTVEGLLVRSDPVRLSGESVDYYTFAGREGQRLTLDLASDEIDTFLTLFLPDGRTETNDDRRGIEDTNSSLSITLPLDGTYVLGASSFGAGESGRYTVHLSEAAPGVRTVRPSSG